MIRRCAAAFVACAAFCVAVGASAVEAQSVSLAGQVVDTAGRPVPDLEVVLHRVDASGGARIARGQSGIDGRFSLASSEGPVREAVYFAATRAEGELFIGPFVRLPLGSDEAYTIIVGGEPFDLGGALPPAEPLQVGASGTPRRWLLALIPAFALVAVAIVWVRGATGPSERRRLLIRIAQLDEVAGSQRAEPAHEERARLIEQLLSLER